MKKISLDPGTHSRVDTWFVTVIWIAKPSMRSGALAKAAGVSPDTLRHYERIGVLKKPPRTAAGYRMYPLEALDRVFLIRNSLAAGFTLQELASILRVRDSGGSPCKQVADLADEKVRALEMQIAQLIQLRDSLKETLVEWNRRLKKMSPGSRAGLLESLPGEKNKRSTHTRGEANENAMDGSRPGDLGGRLRAKHSVKPHARTAAGKL